MSPSPDSAISSPPAGDALRVIETALPGVVVIEPRVFEDARGFFLESFRAERYAAAGLPTRFVQDNHSRSRRGTLRGLHFQVKHPQGKLIRIARGRVRDAVVDVRPDSPTFGRHATIDLDDEAHRQLWVPPGFAHGFLVLSETADFLYKVTAPYDPTDEGGIRYDDPDLRIDWGAEVLREPFLTMSDKDRALPRLRDLPESALPHVSGPDDEAAR